MSDILRRIEHLLISCKRRDYTLLDHIFKYTPGGFMTVWAKNETGSITRWFDLSEADALHQAHQAAVDLDARGYDVYF